MSETNQQQTEPTPEELKKYRNDMLQFYKEQIPLLKQQAEYERLLAEIEESRAKRITMNLRIAQIMAGPQEEPSQEEMAKMKAQMEEKIKEQGVTTTTSAKDEKLDKEPEGKKSVRQLKSETP